MKGPKIVYVCRECGCTNFKWLGKCPDCGAWNSFDEELIEEDKKHKSPTLHNNHAEKLSELEPRRTLEQIPAWESSTECSEEVLSTDR